MKHNNFSLLILAGGLGTRLRSITGDAPKALVEVDGIPFLYFQLEHWVSQGVRSFVFLLHYQSELIASYVQSLSDNLLENCEVRFVHEPFLMGTGGAVANALRQLKIDGDFLITNADTWLSLGIISICEGRSPLMGVVKVSDAGRYGSVAFDGYGRVKNFSEKDSVHSQYGWINSGISKLNSHLFEKWVDSPFSLERDFFPDLVECGTLFAKPIEPSDFIDIGIPEDYLAFCERVRFKYTGICSGG